MFPGQRALPWGPFLRPLSKGEDVYAQVSGGASHDGPPDLQQDGRFLLQHRTGIITTKH